MALNKNVPLKSTDDLLLALLRGQRNAFSNQVGDNGQSKNPSSFWDTNILGNPTPNFTNDGYPSRGHGNSQTSQDLDKLFRDALGYNNPYSFNFDGTRGSSPTELFGVDKSIGNNKGSSAYGFSYGSGLGKNNGDGDLTNYLGAQLLGWQNDNNMDRAHEAYQNYLNRLMTLDQRSYDSVAAQVQRLMAAGVSREAALALVNGSAGAGTTQQSVEGIAPSESRLNEEQVNQLEQEQVLAPINTAFQGISTLTGLFGAATQCLSIPGIIANNTIAKNNAYASNLMRSANDGIGAMNGILGSAESLSQLTAADKESPDSLRNWFERQSPDTNAAAYDFVQSGQMSKLYDNPFGLSAITDNFCTRKTPQKLNNEILNAEREAEFRRLKNIGEGFRNYFQSLQCDWQETANARAVMDYVDWSKVHDWATDAAMYEYMEKTFTLSQVQDPQTAKLLRETYLKDKQYAACDLKYKLLVTRHKLEVEQEGFNLEDAKFDYFNEQLGLYKSTPGSYAAGAKAALRVGQQIVDANRHDVTDVNGKSYQYFVVTSKGDSIGYNGTLLNQLTGF